MKNAFLKSHVLFQPNFLIPSSNFWWTQLSPICFLSEHQGGRMEQSEQEKAGFAF